MAKFFRKFDKKRAPQSAPHRPHPASGKKEDLMDPILFQGGLDAEKYPALTLEKTKKPKEEVENPLNRR